MELTQDWENNDSATERQRDSGERFANSPFQLAGEQRRRNPRNAGKKKTLDSSGMQHHQSPSEADHSAPTSPVVAAAAAAHTIQPSSPRLFFSSLAAGNTTASSHRRIAIAVDLSDESAYAVKWAVQNYLRPGDAVILLHVRPTSVLYGADWGSIDLSVSEAAAAAEEVDSEQSQQKLEEDFDAFTTTKAHDLAQPLVESHIPFKIHIVKDHDMKERLCLEVERLGLSAVIMGSRGFGASKRSGKGRLGSVSDYCVHHCVCPVVVVRYPDEAAGGLTEDGIASNAVSTAINKEAELHPVPEEEEFHDASDAQKVHSVLRIMLPDDTGPLLLFTSWPAAFSRKIKNTHDGESICIHYLGMNFDSLYLTYAISISIDKFILNCWN
ncbi:hypothetical protein IEQ34_012581 [Dendrobium chrysotoxum]|uniref:UspA domain-containing protein n=1 Tax=Dendrobium chrysotoxum TaxID=161865 RepID=A0AAV7GW10_DENCH|nr:hypothetical protein IEQ34_012581 [Dendrobium chrysotoxum]